MANYYIRNVLLKSSLLSFALSCSLPDLSTEVVNVKTSTKSSWTFPAFGTEKSGVCNENF